MDTPAANSATPSDRRMPATGYEEFLGSIEHKKPRDVKVRDFIGMWGYKRRGSTIVTLIENELENRGLICVPDIATADYYGKIAILDKEDLATQPTPQMGWPISSVLEEERQLVFVGPDTKLCEVETLMVMHGFSQIPVISKGKRELHGSVTWKSLARWTGSRDSSTAKQAMSRDDYRARSSDSLLIHIGAIIENEFIYIQSPEKEFVGILTASDLGKSFLETAGPFIKLGEIEQRIRALVDLLPLDAIQSAKNEADLAREIRSASDLTFGEYIRVLEKPDFWDRIGLDFDRVTVVKNLREVNAIRNDVMHFRPRPLEQEKIQSIDWCLNLLREARPR